MYQWQFQWFQQRDISLALQDVRKMNLATSTQDSGGSARGQRSPELAGAKKNHTVLAHCSSWAPRRRATKIFGIAATYLMSTPWRGTVSRFGPCVDGEAAMDRTNPRNEHASRPREQARIQDQASRRCEAQGAGARE